MTARADAEESPRNGRPASVVERRLRAIGLCAVALFAVHNALPYLGLRYESCQTMYSGLRTSAVGNNHLIAPQVSFGDIATYFTDVRVSAPATADPEAAVDVGRLNRPDQYVNAEALRVIVRRLCRGGQPIRLSLREPGGDRIDVRDACIVERFSRPGWWIPVRLYTPFLRTKNERWEECQPIGGGAAVEEGSA